MLTVAGAAVAAGALATSYLIGLRDAANSVSTTITTRTLREETALRFAALLTLLGALLGISLMTALVSYGSDLLNLRELTEPALLQEARTVTHFLGAALLAYLVWASVLWWIGHPSSSWYILLSALAGSVFALGLPVRWGEPVLLIYGSTLTTAVLGFGLSYALMHGTGWLCMRELATPGRMRFAQTASAGAMAATQGINNIRMPVGVILLLASTDAIPQTAVLPLVIAAAAAMALGVLVGGHRIIRTVGRRITNMTTAQGLTAESTSALLGLLGALGLGVPVSTSQLLASSVTGAGAAMSVRGVRWPTVLQLVCQWLLSPVVAAGLGALFSVLILRLLAMA